VTLCIPTRQVKDKAKKELVTASNYERLKQLCEKDWRSAYIVSRFTGNK